MRKYFIRTYLGQHCRFCKKSKPLQVKFDQAQRRLSKTVEADQDRIGSLQGIVINKRRQQLQGLKQFRRENSIQEIQRQINQNIVQIDLYMKHDQWKSQYINAILNYHKLGFRRISDLVMLDRASYNLQLRDVPQEQRWPYAKINVALLPAIKLKGTKQIYDFFNQNYYFETPIDKQSSLLQSLEKYIDQSVTPHLEAIFWHPILTFQYTFHTNKHSYFQGMKSFMILGILRLNLTMVIKRIFRNLRNIRNQTQRYENAKQNLTKSLKQLQKLIQASGNYFGGEKPNHVDFYLFSILKTKEGSYKFMRYLENQVDGTFWRWWIRMGMITQYNPQRITLK